MNKDLLQTNFSTQKQQKKVVYFSPLIEKLHIFFKIIIWNIFLTSCRETSRSLKNSDKSLIEILLWYATKKPQAQT